MNYKPILEGLLFVCGDEGLTYHKIKMILEIKDHELDDIITSLKAEYANENRGITLNTYGDKLKLVTKKEHKEYISKLMSTESRESLSQSALETLAIVAYNEPIVRSSIDEIRGVDSSHIIRKLLLRNLIEVKGKSDLPGRPLLYGVTNDFLDHFGLESTNQLPIINIENEEQIDSNLYDSKYKEA